MDIKNLIKLEPIDITQIVITFGVVLLVIYAFKTQLNNFVDTLKDRPITVKMSGSETTIKLDAPVTPELLSESIQNPQGSEEQLSEWEQTVEYVSNIEEFAKLGFDDLYTRLSSLEEGELAVINYSVDDPQKHYFNDQAMLRYLSIAAEKIRYLAFYKDGDFVAVIGIQDVISALASNNHQFQNFGQKLRNGQWQQFPGLISRDTGFHGTPSVKALYNRLTSTGLTEVPLVEGNNLKGFLNYQSISNELYGQIAESS